MTIWLLESSIIISPSPSTTDTKPGSLHANRAFVSCSIISSCNVAILSPHYVSLTTGGARHRVFPASFPPTSAAAVNNLSNVPSTAGFGKYILIYLNRKSSTKQDLLGRSGKSDIDNSSKSRYGRTCRLKTVHLQYGTSSTGYI